MPHARPRWRRLTGFLLDAQLYLLTAPWMALAPGFALTITLLLLGQLRSLFEGPGMR